MQVKQLPGHVLAQWYVEFLSEAKSWHHQIFPGYDCVFRLEELVLQGKRVNSSKSFSQSNINKSEFTLNWIGLKQFRKIFRWFTVIEI